MCGLYFACFSIYDTQAYLSMIICDFNVICVAIDERKADSPLIIYGNRVLPRTFTFQGVETIAWRDLQVTKTCGKIDVFQAAHGSS
jgi:hypothetical protein